ncbi:MAG: GrpB family protein [Defluviitaleaceae bacterium]|nr:GrpB family protein [Defluviitaleaceae bacterium]
MKKQLSEMTLEELWGFFPIILKEYNPQYINWYENEKQHIIDIVGSENILRISHIGSTAVKGLISKPTIDILLEIDGCCDVTKLTNVLTEAGWGLMQTESNPTKIKFCKGYTPNGFADKVFHLHVAYMGDWSELYFRDYLIVHPVVVAEYGKIKQDLLTNYEHDRDGYTRAKSDFVLKYSNTAKHEFHSRYKPK